MLVLPADGCHPPPFKPRQARPPASVVSVAWKEAPKTRAPSVVRGPERPEEMEASTSAAEVPGDGETSVRSTSGGLPAGPRTLGADRRYPNRWQSC